MTTRDYNGLTYTILDATTASVKSTTVNSCPANPTIETSIEIPESSGNYYTVTTVSNNGFIYNNTLETLILPNTITTIENYSFEECYVLTSIYIPNTCINIGTNAFATNNNLITVEFETGTTLSSFPENMFSDCSTLLTIDIPNSVTSLGNNCFLNSGITTITGGDSVVNLGSNCFERCTNLSSLPEFPLVTIYPAECFYQCSFTSIIVPDTITTLNLKCFDNNVNLTSITFGNSVSDIQNIFQDISSKLNLNTVIWKNAPIVASPTFTNFLFFANILNVVYLNVHSYEELSLYPTSKAIYDASFTSSTVTWAAYPCFKRNTKILIIDSVKNEEKYIPVQDLKVGDLVKTIYNYGAYKPISHIKRSNYYYKDTNEQTHDNLKKRLYICKPVDFPELFEDLVMTGAHSILVPHLTDSERKYILEMYGRIYVTDGNYRLPVCIDTRASLYKEIDRTEIYNFALESEDVHTNYGVFANGLLVECATKYDLQP